MADKAPKVRRKGGRQTTITYVLVGVAVLLVAAVAALLFTGDLFSSEPQTDAERDYQLLLKGLEKNPKDPAVLMTLAEAEFDLGKEREALGHARSAVVYAKEQPAYRLRYASLLLRVDDVETAKKMVQEEIDLKTKGDPEPFFLMAQIERESGNLEEAEANIQKALDLVPTSADFIVVYGTILERQGKKDDAVAAYKGALKYLPDFQPALDGLKRLGVKPPESTESTAHSEPSAP